MPRKKRTAEAFAPAAFDSLSAMREAADLAKEGNYKLSQAVDIMRAALELIYSAEFDHEKGQPVSAKDLRGMARTALDQYSKLVGQDWRRNPLKGSYAGDRSNAEGYGG